MQFVRSALFIPLTLLLLSFSSSVSSPAQAAEFKIVVNPGTKAFAPQEITVKLGDQVSWINKSEEEHFLTSAGGRKIEVVPGTEFLLIHQLLNPGDRYTHTFSEADTYYYFCAIHMEMWGTVTVEE
jgi:plastocyanin